jgi:hypothetical protein
METRSIDIDKSMMLGLKKEILGKQHDAQMYAAIFAMMLIATITILAFGVYVVMAR